MTDERKKKILVVDDERNIRKLITDVLRKNSNYEVEDAVDGEDALTKLKAANFEFDLVITDVQMPKMNGEELIAEIVKDNTDIAIIVLTAHKRDESVIRCLEMGATEYLTKPISVEKLTQTVRRDLDRQNRFEGQGEEVTVVSGTRGWVELTAPSDFEYVERFQAFTSMLGSIPLADEAREDIRVAVDELGQNAVEWGNRHDRNKSIRLSYCVFEDRIVFKIEDEGEGFQPAKLSDPSMDPLAHIMSRMQSGKRVGGYGVFIAKKLMDDIIFNESGNTVIMTKLFKHEEA